MQECGNAAISKGDVRTTRLSLGRRVGAAEYGTEVVFSLSVSLLL